ncbi:hypothetical protein TNCV_843941 [Trichonephila clavipes]|nr:hypothetical protein TNCV_843941 [Trichonephila clavipes]
MKPCPDLSPNQLALRITCGTETSLIHKEDTIPLKRCPVFCLLTPFETVPPMADFQREAGFRTVGDRPTLGRRLATDDISVIYCSCFPRQATTNLSNSCNYGLEDFPNSRNKTFVDSEFSYTGQTMPLLQLSDCSFMYEVVQVISSSHVSRKNSITLAVNAFIRASVLPFIVVLSCARRLHTFCVHSRHTYDVLFLTFIHASPFH